MIALDASVVIAHLAAHDAHHDAAVKFFQTNVDDEFLLHSLTLTEILVGPTRIGQAHFALEQLERLRISEWAPRPGSATRLARLRVDAGLKLPDCCVLEAAIASGSRLATLDQRLARSATRAGVELVEI